VRLKRPPSPVIDIEAVDEVPPLDPAVPFSSGAGQRSEESQVLVPGSSVEDSDPTEIMEDSPDAGRKRLSRSRSLEELSSPGSSRSLLGLGAGAVLVRMVRALLRTNLARRVKIGVRIVAPSPLEGVGEAGYVNAWRTTDWKVPESTSGMTLCSLVKSRRVFWTTPD